MLAHVTPDMKQHLLHILFGPLAPLLDNPKFISEFTFLNDPTALTP